jgi:hypothetical protein
VINSLTGYQTGYILTLLPVLKIFKEVILVCNGDFQKYEKVRELAKEL